MPKILKRQYPVRCGVFFSADNRAMSRAIRYFSRPYTYNPFKLAQYSHCGFVFEFAYGNRVRHEALGSQGWHEKQSWDALVEFTQTGGWAMVCWIDLPSFLRDRLFDVSESRIGTKSYAFEQILTTAVLNSVLLRWAELSLPGKDNRVICSEGVSRYLHEATDGRIDLRPNAPEGSFDSTSPQDCANRLRVYSQGDTHYTWETV